MSAAAILVSKLELARAVVKKILVLPSVILSVLMSACVTDRVPELCVIPVPYVK